MVTKTMNLDHILSDRLFRTAAVLAAVVLLSLLAVNLFAGDQDALVIALNGSIPAPLAVIVAISAALVWNRMSADKQNQYLWRGLLIGWVLWALAEVIWMAYSLAGEAFPYPSLADFFWVLGYLPMGVGLVSRLQLLPVRQKRSQSLVITVLSLTAVLVTLLYILLPVFAGFDPRRLGASLLNIIYPLADLFVLIVVLRMFFTFEQGEYGFGWRLLAVGFMLMTVSDLLYTYLSWQELYYPGMQMDWLSQLGVDIPYVASYLVFFLGIFAFRLPVKEEQVQEPAPRIRLVRTYGHILIYTRSDDTVIYFSPNYNRVFDLVEVKGKPLAQVLTIPDLDGREILDRIRKTGLVADHPLRIRNTAGAVQELMLYGVKVTSPQGEYAGSNLLLRMRVSDVTFDDSLDQESRLMTRYILERSGSQSVSEIGQFLADYYLSFIRALNFMVYREGGPAMTQGLLDELLRTVRKHGWPIHFDQQLQLDGKRYPVDLLREALPALLESAKGFVSSVIDPALVEERLQVLRAQLGDSVHRDIAKYGRAGGGTGFSDHRMET